MNNCLGCRKSVTNVYSIFDTVDTVKISDLVAFFLHLETSPGKLLSNYLCSQCLQTLCNCHRMKTVAQTMIGGGHGNALHRLNPDASVFQPRRQVPRPDSPYPFDCIPPPACDDCYCEYSDATHENSSYDLSNEELSGTSSSEAQNNADLDNYLQFRKDVKIMQSSTHSDLRGVERAQFPKARLFSCNEDNKQEAEQLDDYSDQPELGSKTDPWYINSAEEEEELQMVVNENAKAETMKKKDEAAETSERYQSKENNSDSDDNASVYLITIG